MLSSYILVVYPEVLTTKLAVYQGNNLIFLKIIKHRTEDLKQFPEIIDQLQYRTDAVLAELHENEIQLSMITLIMSRGGLIKPVKSGIYEVNDRMKEDLRTGIMGVHETNLGGLIADEISNLIPGAKAYLADPVVVDELDDVARITGLPAIERKSVFHALNHKNIARNYAKSHNKLYEELNLIVAHIGAGGASVGAHCKGKVIDVNQAFDGDGPFSLTRSGSLPVGALIDLCFSGQYTKHQIRKMVTEEGGLNAYLGTPNINVIEDRIESGDEKARFILHAMAYQVAKEIGALFTVLEGDVDGILLSGPIFNSRRFTDEIKRRVGKIAPISVYPTINDMDSLASNALRIIKGEAEILEYI